MSPSQKLPPVPPPINITFQAEPLPDLGFNLGKVYPQSKIYGIFVSDGKRGGNPHLQKEDGMALYLNTDSSYEDFKMLVNGDYFVDKSGIIEKINKRINTKNRYLCITKPRRFGKTSVLNMLGSYYGGAYDSRALFNGLEISRCAGYEEHLNKYHG